MYCRGYEDEEDEDDEDEGGEEDVEEEDTESDATPAPHGMRRGSWHLDRTEEKHVIYVDDRGEPCGSMIKPFNADMRVLTRELDPVGNWAQQHEPVKERFLEKLWSGTSAVCFEEVLFVFLLGSLQSLL